MRGLRPLRPSHSRCGRLATPEPITKCRFLKVFFAKFTKLNAHSLRPLRIWPSALQKAASKGPLKGVYGHLKDQMAVMRSCKTKVRRRSAPAPPQAPLTSNHKPWLCERGHLQLMSCVFFVVPVAFHFTQGVRGQSNWSTKGRAACGWVVQGTFSFQRTRTAEVTHYRHVDASMRRRVDTSTRRRADASTC